METVITTARSTPAGERILEAAAELFYTRGIRAVGVDLIAETAGTTKKTLYDRFGNKEGLVVRYLERRFEHWRTHVLEHLDEHADPGVERVLAVFDALGTWMEANDRGCGFINAFAEVGGTEHPAVPVIRAEKAWSRDLYAALVSEAGIGDPQPLADELSVLHEGAVVIGSSAGHPKLAAVTTARRVAAQLLAARTPRRGP